MNENIDIVRLLLDRKDLNINLILIRTLLIIYEIRKLFLKFSFLTKIFNEIYLNDFYYILVNFYK